MSDAVTIAIVSASSAIAGGVISAFVQFILARAADSRRRAELLEDRDRERIRSFRKRFEKAVIPLIEATSPDINNVPSIPEFTSAIYRLQVILDMRDPEQVKLNDHVSQIGLSMPEYLKTKDKLILYNHHAPIVALARNILSKHDL